MRAVRLLPAELADQIAAGEVVERPASVVKELVENALDAGAATVRIDSERGGTVRIRVTDDGHGMTPEDALLAIRRHATSKIESAEDLRTIRTFGFRGEALPSIAAVSRLTLTTRPAGADSATRIRIAAGGAPEVSEAAAPVGTCVEIDDLFLNVPARRKFLKRVSTEASRVADECARLALCRPDVRVTLTEDGRTRLDAPRVETLAERAPAVLGLRTATELAPVNRRGSVVHVHGLISPPTITRSSSSGIFTFVNGRFVRDRGVHGALVAAYRGLLERGRQPIAVLFLEVDPADVDVNVHPAKQEVRFRIPAAVTGSVVEAVREALAKAEWVGRRVGFYGGAPEPAPHPSPPARTVRLGVGEPPEPSSDLRAPTPFVEAKDRMRDAASRYGRGAEGFGEEPEQSSFPSASRPLLDLGDEGRRYFSSLKVLGTAGNCYIVCEGKEGLVLLDQHAAHERVVYERIRARLAEGGVAVQTFLVPLQVDLSARQRGTLEDRREDLDRVGLETEPFGGSTVLLKTLPAVLVGKDGGRLLVDLLDEMAGDDSGAACRPSAALSDRLDKVAATVACHGSVRAGQALSMEEVRALLHSLDQVEYAGNCPHGRPTLIELSNGEIERRFHRK